jgi:hypothetical protein
MPYLKGFELHNPDLLIPYLSIMTNKDKKVLHNSKLAIQDLKSVYAKFCICSSGFLHIIYISKGKDSTSNIKPIAHDF